MRPVTVQLVVEVEQVNDPGEEVTVYDVMTLPPVLDGAVQDTVIEESPKAVTAEVGAPGTAAGMTAPEAADEVPEPARFLATTVNV